MRFLLMHRLDENVPEVADPGQEFIDRMTAFMGDWAERGILITAEGVFPSETGALVRKSPTAAVTVTDGPFTEAKEIIGGFVLVNAKDRAEACELATRYAAVFEGFEVEVEVRRVVEASDLPGADSVS